MNKRQKELLDKEFKVNKHFSITRGDYEGMPDPLIAFTWSDEQMKQLAKNISNELCPYDKNDPEGMEDDFWATMENVAVRMGMEYYEDLDPNGEEEYEKLWKSITDE